MNVDLEPFIYRQHPVYRLPSREDAALAVKTPEGEKAFRLAMMKRGEMIYNELDDHFANAVPFFTWRT